MERSPRDIDEPLQIPLSSASAEESVTVDWVTLQCFSRWWPLRATPPEVDLLVERQPAKSVSTWEIRWSVFCWKGKCQTNLGTPTR